mgnify:FL=1
MKSEPSQMLSSVSHKESNSPQNQSTEFVVVPCIPNSANTFNVTMNESQQDTTMRNSTKLQLEELIMEYIGDDVNCTSYDFIADLKQSLYELQDHYQTHLTRINAIIAYLHDDCSPDLFVKKGDRLTVENGKVAVEVTDRKEDYNDFWYNSEDVMEYYYESPNTPEYGQDPSQDI